MLAVSQFWLKSTSFESLISHQHQAEVIFWQNECKQMKNGKRKTKTKTKRKRKLQQQADTNRRKRLLLFTKAEQPFKS